MLSNTQKGSFWFCNQNPSCNFFCSEDESYLYEKAAASRLEIYKTTTSFCEKHIKLAKMHVVKNLLKPSYGRPFFVCSDQLNPCSFWACGHVRPLTKPECRHGFSCVIRKVKKEGINDKDRLFFWVPEEP